MTIPQVKQAIGTMQPGKKVWAYNPKTKQMELQPVLHVWINHDNDLVDLTLTATTHAPHSSKTSKVSEVIHTNKKHPFFTEEGFVPVGQLHVGMHVREADGQYGVITGWKAKLGIQTMYNLEVAQDHTFTVGSGQWVVHNCSSGGQTDSTDILNDVAPTLERIDDGDVGKQVHRNDGSTYKNWGGDLPSQPIGYYKEYVVPTPGVKGAGLQRLIIGANGEIYYTPDHYTTFIQLN